MATKKYLYRDTENGKIAGVSAGLADYFEIDVTVIRIIWLVLLFCAGGGLLAYIIMAIVVDPKDVVMKKVAKENNEKTIIDDPEDPFAKYDKK